MDSQHITEGPEMDSVLFLDEISAECTINKAHIQFMLKNLTYPAFVCKWGQNGNLPILEINNPACRLLGIGDENMVGKNLYNVFVPESVGLARENLRTFPKEMDEFWEGSVINKEGHNIPVKVYYSIFTMDDSLHLMVLMKKLSIGISKDKANSGSLSQRAEELANIGYWKYDLNSEEFWGSHGIQSIFGYDRNNLSLDEVNELGISEYIFDPERMHDGLRTGITKYSKDFQIKDTSIDSFSFFRSQSEFDVLENKIHGIVQNISEQKKIEDELIKLKEKSARAESLKKSFFSNMSHEIRTPMNGIIGFSQLLIQPDISPETRSDYSEIISQSCKQLLDIINDIIEVSRIDNDQVKMKTEQIILSDFLNETFDSYKPALNKKKLGWKLNIISKKNLIITTDRAKLTKILTNLLDNAIRFTEKGYIELGCSMKNRIIEFYVKDSGVGISASDREVIFERFHHLENPISGSYDGTGLGLSISKSFLTMLGGKIRVDSVSGEGSTFIFTIPEKIKFETGNDTSTAKADFSSNRMKTCLIADDMKINYIYLNALLSSEGFNVLWAKDGDEAIEMSLNESVDIVLMDLKMPNTDGYEATKVIKSKRPGLPIIAQTACAMQSEQDHAILAGCDDYIAKPIRKEEFLRKIYLLLNINI